MTPSNTPHRLAREATAAELATDAKRLAFLYAERFHAFQWRATQETEHDLKVFRDAMDAAIDRLASLALPQLEEQQRWMPIAEAPKDGRPILVICDGALRPAPAVAHWSSTDGRGWLGGCASDWIGDSDLAEQMYGYFPNATRWAPIQPPPPTQDTTTQEKPNE